MLHRLFRRANEYFGQLGLLMRTHSEDVHESHQFAALLDCRHLFTPLSEPFPAAEDCTAPGRALPFKRLVQFEMRRRLWNCCELKARWNAARLGVDMCCCEFACSRKCRETVREFGGSSEPSLTLWVGVSHA